MSSFYDRQKSASTLSFGDSDQSSSRSPSRFSNANRERSGSSLGFNSERQNSFGAPMHAMMVPGQVVPTLDRPDPDSPFSDWEAYIVKQAQDWSEKKAKAAASPPPTASNAPRIVWADQVRRPSAQSQQQTQPLTYTKARDRVASPPPQGPPPPNPLGLLRKGSMDLLRGSLDIARGSPSPPSSQRPLISSPIISKSTLTTLPSSPLPYHTQPHANDSFNRSMPDPLQVPHNIESQTSSVRSLSPLPLSLGGDDFSASLLINFEKRNSTASTSSGRAPGPCELIAAPLPALLSPEANRPPSIADTYSVHSRRSSWASSVDLDPAIICTPPLSHEEWQDQSSSTRPAFLAEYGIDQSDESETEDSIYPDDESVVAALPPADKLTDEAIREHQLAPQPVFQRLEADLVSLADHGDDMGAASHVPRLDIANLPREKEDVRRARARLISPVSFKKAFSIKKKGANSASNASASTGSSPSLPNSSSEEVGRVSMSPQDESSADSRMVPQLPSLITQDMTSWAAAIPAEAQPVSPTEIPVSPTPRAPSMQMSPSAESFPHVAGSIESSSTGPLSPVFSNSPPSLLSESSRSRDSLANGSVSGKKKHRIGTPGLTKASASAADNGAQPMMDPHLARAVQNRQRSSGSISSQTPSVALSNSSNGRRASRKSGRSRITESMRSFSDMASTLTVPIADQRRFSNRSLSSEGSVDNHSNASNSSSYAKVGGSSDEGAPPMSPALSSTGSVKGVLRKRSVSGESSLLTPKKEVSFDLPMTSEFDIVEEEITEEEETIEYEVKQRAPLSLPPMKLQAPAATDVDATAPSAPTHVLNQDDADIAAFLSSFGGNLQTVESLEVLDNVHAGSSDWPKREDWDSLPAYLLACATTFLSAYSDDSATLVYSAERAPALAVKTISAPLLSSNSMYTSMVRAVVRLGSWEQPLVSAGASSIYTVSWAKGKLVPIVLAGLAFLLATQGAQKGASPSEEQKELSEAYNKIAPVVLGTASTHERMRNLLLWRSPKASVRFTGLLLALAVGATRFDSSFILSLPGLLVGLALFAWLPIILHQPEWAPAALKEVNPVDVLLYDVPTDAQNAILTLRRRAACGEKLVHRVESSARNSALKMLGSLSSTSFDHRVSESELVHVSDILEGAHFATFDNEVGHLIVLASRVIFRTLASKQDEPIALVDELIRERKAAAPKGCKIAFDARLEKVVRMDKVEEQGLKLKLKNGQTFELSNVQDRDQAFNRVLALAPQKWH